MHNLYQSFLSIFCNLRFDSSTGDEIKWGISEYDERIRTYEYDSESSQTLPQQTGC